MFNYLAFVWKPGDPAGEHAAEAGAIAVSRDRLVSWNCVLEHPGVCVYCASDGLDSEVAIPLAGVPGVVLGTLFTHAEVAVESRSTRVTCLSAEQSRTIWQTDGGELTNSFWGSHVAFLARPDRTLVMRGAMSELPCMMMQGGGVTWLFSRIEDCARLGGLRLSIDWDFLKVHVAFREPRSVQSAIREVSLLEGGECLEIEGSRPVRRSYQWHPCRIARSEPVSSFSDATDQMRGTTANVISAWASCHDRILHRLSGGLDSAIVLACLKGASSRPSVTCQTWFSPGPVGDERVYARAAAERHGCSLIERERNPDVDLGIFQRVYPGPFPVRHYSAYESFEAEADLAAKTGARAVFCGGLGDSAFEQLIDEDLAADYLQRHGLDRLFLTVALNVAMAGRVSIWHVAAEGCRRARARRHRRGRWQYLCPLGDRNRLRSNSLVPGPVIDEAEALAGRFIHPWFNECAGVPERKLWMIANLTAEMTYAGPFMAPGAPAVVSPLASRPLVDLCLRIESHLNASRGIDRAVAREAFRDELPESILHRCSKGGPDAWTEKIIRRNAEWIRKFLCDGALTAKGLLDPDRITRMLTDGPTKMQFRTGDIIRHLYTEGWVRAWMQVAL